MALYRKKPVEVEAHQWFHNGDHPGDGPNPEVEGKIVRRYRHPFVRGAALCSSCSQPYDKYGWIDTLEGGHIVCPGDWIITGMAGERYPCKSSIFQATYTLVES